VWNEDQIQVRYAQNTILFADEALVRSRPELEHELERTRQHQLSVVHPKIFQRIARSSAPRADAPADAGQPEQPFEARLQSLDPGLLGGVPSQSTEADRISLLALHNACREAYGTFRYLEIGSHLGGSLQALIADDRCAAITSIDSRPRRQPDARGVDFTYPGNSTERMLAYLRTVPGADLAKLRTVDASTENLSVESFEGAAQFCFVDAEHTHDAALRDARFCRGVIGDEGAIAFHDRRLVSDAIEDFTGELDTGTFTAYGLPSSIFVIELGPVRLAQTEWVAKLVEEPGARPAP
jgi:hypothetical protein